MGISKKAETSGNLQRRRLAGALDNGNSHDISVVLRLHGETADYVSRAELFCSSAELRTGFLYDRTSSLFGGVSQKMLDAALRQLLAEIKFRRKAGQLFSIWYNSSLERDILEAAAGRLAEDYPTLRRSVDYLLEHGRLRSELTDSI